MIASSRHELRGISIQLRKNNPPPRPHLAPLRHTRAPRTFQTHRSLSFAGSTAYTPLQPPESRTPRRRWCAAAKRPRHQRALRPCEVVPPIWPRRLHNRENLYLRNMRLFVDLLNQFEQRHLCTIQENFTRDNSSGVRSSLMISTSISLKHL